MKVIKAQSLSELMNYTGKKKIYYYNMTLGNSAKVFTPKELFEKYGGIPLIIKSVKFHKQKTQEHEYHLTNMWMIK